MSLTERSRGEQWRVPARLHGSGLQGTFTADVDLRTVAAGGPLGPGTWELSAHFKVLGLGSPARVRVMKERTGSLPSVCASLPLLRARLFHSGQAVSLEVHARGGGPARWIRRVPAGVRWRARRAIRRIRAAQAGR